MKLNGNSSPIRINGFNIDLGDALPQKIQEELMHIAKTSFGHLNHGSVGFSRDGNWYSCTINIQVGNRKVLVAESTAADCSRAFDHALAKVGRQLHRRKHRAADSGRREIAAQFA